MSSTLNGSFFQDSVCYGQIFSEKQKKWYHIKSSHSEILKNWSKSMFVTPKFPRFKYTEDQIHCSILWSFLPRICVIRSIFLWKFAIITSRENFQSWLNLVYYCTQELPIKVKRNDYIFFQKLEFATINIWWLWDSPTF